MSIADPLIYTKNMKRTVTSIRSLQDMMERRSLLKDVFT